MKKTLIAGAASLAVAAMPVAGVFAAGMTQTDNLEVVITKNCAIDTVSHADGAATWEDGTLSKAIVAGNYEASFGSTEFTIICNNKDGWKVTAVADANLTTGSDNLPLLFSAISNASESGYTVTTSTSDATVSNTGIMASASQIVAQSSTPTVSAGAKFTSSYAVAVADGQAAGTYEGSVTYTLAEL